MADRLYRAAPAAGLRIQPLDEFTAIYHRASGITHLVTAPVPEVMALLREPLSEAELLDRLSDTFDLGDADGAALSARLHELVDAGLVSVA